MATDYRNYSNTDKLAMIAAEVEYIADNGGGGGGGDSLPAGGTTGQVLAKKSNADGDVEWANATGGGNADFEVDQTNLTASTSNSTSHLTFDFSTPNKLSVVSAMPNTFYQERNIATDADITDLQSQIDALGEPFKVIQWTGDPNKTIPVCTQDLDNTQIDKLTFTTPAELQADYQIVGMVAYEVFDATSGGKRINCWPVCQFTGQNQTELSVRFMCAGTTSKQARRISAWVLLKHR